MNLLVVGAGSVGQWFAGAIGADVAFADLDDAAAEGAAETVGGRAVSLETDERFEVVCLAVPMTVAVPAIEAYAPTATAAVIDLTGAMSGPVRAMNEFASGLERASFHPLFAPANAPGRIACATVQAGPTIDAVRDRLKTAGNVLFETTPDEHDEAMETVQARAHAAVLAFGLAAEAVPESFGTPVYDRLTALVEEVADGNPRVYADIQATFGGADDVAEAAGRIAAADPEQFERLYRDVGR